MKNKHVVISVFLLLVFACGTETSSDGGAGQEIDPYGDPPGYSGDPFAGYGPVTSILLPASGESMAVPVVSGAWSVQIAACPTAESAQSLSEAVKALFDEPVYVDQTGSYYKVRVGAYSTSDATSELRNRLRAAGYPDAWSVEREPMP